MHSGGKWASCPTSQRPHGRVIDVARGKGPPHAAGDAVDRRVRKPSGHGVQGADGDANAARMVVASDDLSSTSTCTRSFARWSRSRERCSAASRMRVRRGPFPPPPRHRRLRGRRSGRRLIGCETSYTSSIETGFFHLFSSSSVCIFDKSTTNSTFVLSNVTAVYFGRS